MKILSVKCTTLHDLCDSLGIEPDGDFCEIGSKLIPQRITDFDEKIRVMELTKINRQKSLITLMGEIKALLNDLGITEHHDDI